MAIAVPTGVKIFNWLFTLWGGQIKFNVAMLYSVAFIPSFLVGGMTGVMLSVAPEDYQYHDSYFVVAHFHYVIVGGVVYGLFADFTTGSHSCSVRRSLRTWVLAVLVVLYRIPLDVLPATLPRIVRNATSCLHLSRWTRLGYVEHAFDIRCILHGRLDYRLARRCDESLLVERKRQTRPLGRRTYTRVDAPVPTPEYNFAQTPLVKGLDTFWLEKMAGNKRVSVAEPISDIHMPNNSLIPFFMSLGLFIAGLGAIFQMDNTVVGWGLIVFGLLMTFVSMFLRSWMTITGTISRNRKSKQTLKQFVRRETNKWHMQLRNTL